MSLIKYVGDYVSKIIQESTVDEILDFSNPKQLEKFKDIEDSLPEDLELNEDFKYRLS